MLNIYLTIDGIIAASLILLSLASLLKKGYLSKSNRLFAFFSVLVALWIITNHVSNDVAVPNNIALFADYIVFSSSLGVAILLMQFISGLAGVRRLEKIVRLSLAPLWIMCALCFTPLVVNSVVAQKDIYSIMFGPLIWLYAICIFYTLFIIAYGVFHGLRHNSGIKKRQLSTINIGLVLSLPLIVLLSFIIPVTTGNFSVTEFGITPLIILVISIYYGVIRYSLFDIKLAAVRTVTYALSLIVLTVAYFGLTYVLPLALFRDDTRPSVSNNSLGIILTILLAFIFQPVKRFFNKITNRVFYKDNYNTDDFFEKLNKILGFTTDLRTLLQHTATEIGTTLKGEQTFFYIKVDDDHFITAGTVGHKQLPKADIEQLGNFVESKNGVIIASLLEDNDSVKRLMISHRIELALPLVQDNKAIGYLFLGDHLTSNYTNRDIKVLNTISNELIIAIQNALAVQEIREFNITLQQRIANATRKLHTSNAQLRHLDKAKDEFLSMASHQLRTPLTSVKGYISMIMDGDVGRVSGDQKKLLGEAFNNSERMVGLINDFLSVSRIQTGRFLIEKTPIDLSLVVEQEVDSLRANANARQMELVYNRPDDCPIMDIDEGKIRQVIMNFIDNAIYYSHPNTKINIDLSVDKGEILFTVKDTGIGVPKTERDQLFTKFYRASNAKKTRPDGTGVGLFLAKKVVDGHDGDVVFDSVEGKGSTFGFRLPIKPLSTASDSSQS